MFTFENNVFEGAPPVFDEERMNQSAQPEPPRPRQSEDMLKDAADMNSPETLRRRRMGELLQDPPDVG